MPSFDQTPTQLARLTGHLIWANPIAYTCCQKLDNNSTASSRGVELGSVFVACAIVSAKAMLGLFYLFLMQLLENRVQSHLASLAQNQ